LYQCPEYTACGTVIMRAYEYPSSILSSFM
jgi:hypothetical protein